MIAGIGAGVVLVVVVAVLLARKRSGSAVQVVQVFGPVAWAGPARWNGRCRVRGPESLPRPVAVLLAQDAPARGGRLSRAASRGPRLRGLLGFAGCPGRWLLGLDRRVVGLVLVLVFVWSIVLNNFGGPQ